MGTSFREGEGWVLCNEITAGADTLTRRITTFTRSGRTWRRADEEHVLRLFEPAEVVAELHRAGYDAQRLRSYGREQRSLPGLAFFAARPARAQHEVVVLGRLDVAQHLGHPAVGVDHERRALVAPVRAPVHRFFSTHTP